MHFKKFKALCEQKGIRFIEPTDNTNIFKGVNEKGETLLTFETGERGIIKYIVEGFSASGQPKVFNLDTIPFLANGQTSELTLIKLGYDVTVNHIRGEVREIKATKENEPSVRYSVRDNMSLPTTRIKFQNEDKLVITLFPKALKALQN